MGFPTTKKSYYDCSTVNTKLYVKFQTENMNFPFLIDKRGHNDQNSDRLVEKVQNLTLLLVLLCAVGAFWGVGGE